MRIQGSPICQTFSVPTYHSCQIQSTVAYQCSISQLSTCKILSKIGQSHSFNSIHFRLLEIFQKRWNSKACIFWCKKLQIHARYFCNIHFPNLKTPGIYRLSYQRQVSSRQDCMVVLPAVGTGKQRQGKPIITSLILQSWFLRKKILKENTIEV